MFADLERAASGLPASVIGARQLAQGRQRTLQNAPLALKQAPRFEERLVAA